MNVPVIALDFRDRPRFRAPPPPPETGTECQQVKHQVRRRADIITIAKLAHDATRERLLDTFTIKIVLSRYIQ